MLKLRNLINESTSTVPTTFDYDTFRTELKKVVTYADCTYKDSTNILLIYLDTNPNVEKNLVNKLVRTNYSDLLKRMPSEPDKMKFKVIIKEGVNIPAANIHPWVKTAMEDVRDDINYYLSDKANIRVDWKLLKSKINDLYKVINKYHK